MTKETKISDRRISSKAKTGSKTERKQKRKTSAPIRMKS
jgi:hypothetical protein